MKPGSDPLLPRSPKNLDELRRLRKEAVRRLEGEERAPLAPVEPGPAPLDDEPAPVYGGPPPVANRPAPTYFGPAPVYGGPPPVPRRLTLLGLLLVPLGIVGGIVARLFGGGRIDAPLTALFRQSAPVYGGPPPRPPQPPPQPDEQAQRTLIRAIQTYNGHLLTAVKGGGLGNPNSAPEGVALSTGATTAGPFETFTFVWVNKAENTFTLRSHDGHLVTAVNGGGIGGPDTVKAPIHADAKGFAPWASFTITLLPDSVHATIQTADGKHFLSAVNGGGVGGSNQVPLHTDTTIMGTAAIFQLVSVPPTPTPGPTSAPPHGVPPRKPSS